MWQNLLKIKETVSDESGCANSEQAGAESDPAQDTGIFWLCFMYPVSRLRR
ncbi:helicase/Zfx/Zfy transcription activation region domain-containing protein [Escherichia coli]|uniref:Helicase/Zfx/Zfy transcription activation region domain-containing protein n=1 Tax=Escherichia coli TaxID=562 RepID=A0A376KM05_ECOLX|nr:helicase/Zfx/Zfy transcription activation region domain-containing protein [Escherichia coli]